MCIDPILYFLGVVVSLMMGMFVLLLLISYLSLRYFPKSKFSLWSRKNILTDVDLEP